MPVPSAARPDRLTARGITDSLSGRVPWRNPAATLPRNLMPRVPHARLVAVAIAAALAVGACQTGPAAPTLTDPREILAAAVTSTAAARSVRLDATADGTITVDLLGMGTPSPIELAGTTVTADLDLEGGDARATFSAPNLLGLTGEVIGVDGTTYLKSTLTGTRYQVLSAGPDIPVPSGAARASILKDITDFLADPALDPVKGEDATCGSTTCYRVDIVLTPEELAALGAADLEAPAGLPIPIPIPDLSAASVDLSVLVAKDTTRLTGLKAVVDLGGGAGVATIDLTLSKWDEDVSITAPPADQVAPSR